MKTEKMLFYLIIAIIIGLFIYVTYNLIINTCGCIKEGFNTGAGATGTAGATGAAGATVTTVTTGAGAGAGGAGAGGAGGAGAGSATTECTNTIYSHLKDKSQSIGEQCKVNNICGYLNLRNFSGGNFYEYKRKDGTTCLEKEYFADLHTKNKINKCEKSQITSTGNFDDNLFNNQDKFSELDKNNSPFPTEFERLGENNSYVNFIKNIFKKVLSVVSLKNLDFTDSTDLSANYIDIDFKFENVLRYPHGKILPIDIITKIGNEKIIDIIDKKYVEPDMSYNNIFKMEVIEVLKGDTIVKKYNTVQALKGEYKLVRGNLWKRNSEKNINKFYIEYKNNNFYLCYNNEGKMIYLFKIYQGDIDVIDKSLDGVLYNSDKIYQGTLDPSYNMTYESQNKIKNIPNWSDISFCKDNYILNQENFNKFTKKLFQDASWNDTKKKQCNEACFIDPQHVYYFGPNIFPSTSTNKVFMSKDAWKNRTLTDEGRIASNLNWKCNKFCPDGLFAWDDISGAARAGKIPDTDASQLNDVNKYWFANQFGCPYPYSNSGNPPDEDKQNKVPQSLISQYIALTDNNPEINPLTGKFINGKDSCRSGAEIYSRLVSSNNSNDTNLIVEFYLRRKAQDANIPEEDLYIGSCDRTECTKEANVMSGGILYTIKKSNTCTESSNGSDCNPLLPQYILQEEADIGAVMGNESKLREIKEYRCGECRPKRNEDYLSFLTSQGDEESSSYSSSTKNDIDETLENPQQQCKEDGDWLQRLKDSAKTEYYLDDSEKIRQIGQEYLTQLCSCMGYKSTCAVSLLEAETIGKYFVQYAKNETSMAGLSERTSEIIKSNKFDLFSDMFGEGEVNSYDAIWDLDLSKMS